MPNPSTASAAAPIGIRRFAFGVAGPREFAIAGAINGVIAWLMFRGMPRVPLVDGYGLSTMLIPMSFLLPGLSSYFGVLVGALGRKARAITPPLPPQTRWLAFAVRVGLLRGLAGGACGLLLYYALRDPLNGAAWSAWGAIAGIFLLSGILAYLVHSTAVLATLRLPTGPSVEEKPYAGDDS